MARPGPEIAPHVALAGGGSGGHVFPALAVGEELLDRGWRVSYVGSPGGMEEGIARSRGFAYHALPSRPLVGRSLVSRGGTLAVLGLSALRARRLLRRLAAGVVVGTGGYASAPAVLGARLARLPVLLFEPNARAGVANRSLGRFATEAAVGAAETGRDFSCPVVVTGVPVRRELAERRGSPLPGSRRLLVLGGSQGARELNQLLPRVVPRLAPRLPGLEVLHQAGRRHGEATRVAYAGRDLGGAAVKVVPFIEDMGRQLAAASLVVSRAGAITLAEICTVGRPSLLVPLGLAGGHQVENARHLVAAGAAAMLEPGKADVESLAAALEVLLGDPGKLQVMAEAAGSLARPDAAGRIADRVEALGRRTA